MLKVAFFVEGQTERIFIENLLNEFFTHPFFNVDSVEIVGGRATIVTKGHYKHDEVRLSFLIYDVQGDSRVISAINERADDLKSKDYQHIIGIRDVYPAKKNEIAIIRDTFQQLAVKNGIDEIATLILAIMEIEAWFLADPSIFERIDNQLNLDLINENLEIDIEHDLIEDYDHPAVVLNSIYNLVGLQYKKKAKEIHSICHRIDYTNLCFNESVQNKVPHFSNLIEKLYEI